MPTAARKVVDRVDYEYNRCPERICRVSMAGVAASVSCGIAGVDTYVAVGIFSGFDILCQTTVRKVVDRVDYKYIAVCTDNICRVPMAALAASVSCRTAGVDACVRVGFVSVFDTAPNYSTQSGGGQS